MDRFEASVAGLPEVNESDLHSSMDRFEGGAVDPANYDEKIFTFQYG